MKESTPYEQDLASIRSLMERSVKFLSLSGLSGIFAGSYALVGAFMAYKILYYNSAPYGYQFHFIDSNIAAVQLLVIALIVLVLSMITAFLFSLRKARQANVSLWGPASRQLLADISIPLISGGLFLLIMIQFGYYGTLAGACLIFYGLALAAGGRHTFPEIRYLGLFEIIIGLFCASYPAYSLICWASGFGLLHIIYGTIMHFRYERG